MRVSIKRVNIIDCLIVFFCISCIAFDDGTPIVQISRIAIICAALVKFVHKRVSSTVYYYWSILLVCVVFISRFWAANKDNAQTIFTTVLYNSLCFSCLVYLLYKDKKRISLSLICVVIAPSILELRVVLLGGLLAFLDTRALGAISANTVGMVGTFGVFSALALSRLNRNKIFLMFAVINGIISLLSASRKALMSIVAVAVLILIFNRNNGFIEKIWKLCIAVLCFIFVVLLMFDNPFLYNLVGWRFEGMINGFLGVESQTDASTETRMELVEYGIEWFQSKPFSGYGGDNFRYLMSVQHSGQTAFYAHNNFIELLVDYGILGFVTYYSMYVFLIFKGLLNYKKISSTTISMICLISGQLIMEYGMVDYYSRYTQLYIVIAYSMLVCDLLKNRNNSQVYVKEFPAWHKYA